MRRPAGSPRWGAGGSDTSAVALAERAWRGALRHLYRCGRRLHDRPAQSWRKARRLDRVSYEEMLEMASLGAKVLQVRSVEGGDGPQCSDLCCVQSFDDPAAPQSRDADLRRKEEIRGTADRHRHRLFAGRSADHPAPRSPTSRAWPPRSFVPLAEANINVDMIIQVVSRDSATTDITFTVPASDCERRQDPARAEPLGDRIRITPG